MLARGISGISGVRPIRLPADLLRPCFLYFECPVVVVFNAIAWRGFVPEKTGVADYAHSHLCADEEAPSDDADVAGVRASREGLADAPRPREGAPLLPGTEQLLQHQPCNCIHRHAPDPR